MYDPLTIAQNLIRCPSVTPHEAGALDYLQTLLSDAGFTCHRLIFSDSDTPDVDNLYAHFGSGVPHLCFAGHTDVVPPGDESRWTSPPFSPTIRDEKLYGRGAVDMKGGIAAFTAAALNYTSTCHGSAPGSISLLITGDEEGPAINGTVKMLQWIAAQGYLIDNCVVGEPTNVDILGDMIKIGRRGSLSGKLIVHGKQGHVAYPHLADNPIPGLVRLLSALLEFSFDQGSDAFQPSNLEVTSIETGNLANNVIPGEVTARFNIRFNDLWTAETLEARVRGLLDAAAEHGARHIDYTLTCRSNARAFLTPPDLFTELVKKVVQKVTGQVPSLSTTGGTSDARFIRDYCPVVEFGLINKSMHQIDEHVRITDLYDLSKIYHDLMDAYFSENRASQSNSSG